MEINEDCKIKTEQIQGNEMSIFSSNAELISMEPKINSIKDHWVYFASTTKAHGFLQMATTEALSGRILWSVIVILTFGGLIFHFITMLMIYLKHEVQTEMVNNAVPFVMPSIVICPDNPYVKLFKIDRIAVFNLTLSGVFNIFNGFWRIVNKTTNNQLKSRLSLAPYAKEYGLFTKTDDFTTFCKYQNILKCNVSNFMTENLSVCMKIDLPEQNDKITFSQNNIWFSYFIDASYPANITFYDKNELYFSRNPYLTFQPRNEYPDFHSNKINGKKGYMTTIYVHIRIQQEYLIKNSCLTNLVNFKVLSYDNKIEEFAYSKSLCLMIRKQNYIAENCKCYSETLPIPIYSDNITIENVPFCHKMSRDFIEFLKSNPTVDLILNQKESTVLKNNSLCHDNFIDSWKDDVTCLSPCTSLSYSWTNINNVNWPTVTFSNIPNVNLIQDITANLKAKANKYNVSESELQYYSLFQGSGKINYLKLASFRILPQNLAGLKITETESYPLTNFLSSIGCILVLWVGISIINILEFIEMVINMIWSIFHQKN